MRLQCLLVEARCSWSVSPRLIPIILGDALYLVPQRLIPRDQAWFWSAEWQERAREASQAIARGELSGPFETAEEVVRHRRSR